MQEKNEMPFKPVKLRNGAIVPDIMAIIVYTSLQSLRVRAGIAETLAFYDVVMKCRDEHHRIDPGFGIPERLTRLGFLDENGNIANDEVRNVILASSQGEGLEMQLVYPFVDEEE